MSPLPDRWVLVSLLEWTILAVAGWQGVRIAIKPPFRRDAAALPRLAASIGAAVVLAAGLALWAVARWAMVRHVAAIVAASLLLAAWWRARPLYGKRRGWPPGSLGIGRSLNAVDQRDFYLDEARTHGPVFKMSQFGRPVVCVVGLARGRELLSSAGDALGAATLPYNRRFPKGTLRYMPARVHREEAPLFRKTFASLDLGAGEADIRAACRAMLDRLARDSRASSGGVRGREYFESWLQLSLARIFFGLAPNDPRVHEIERAVASLSFDRSGGAAWQRRLEEALVAMTGLMRRIARDGASPTDGAAPGSALGVFLDANPAALDDSSQARNLFLVYRLSLGDLTGLADWLFKMLSDNPEWQEKVRAAGRTVGSPNGAQPGDTATRVVLETLRLEQSEFIYRRVARTMTVGEYIIPAGWLLRICVQESHRDPATFPDPQRFDPDRFLARTYGRSEYSPFGADERGCMGSRLALFLGRTFVEELSHGYEWDITRTGPLERGSRHRHHWRPSAESRAVVRAITPSASAPRVGAESRQEA